MSTENEILIEKYFENQLSEEEIVLFEETIKQNQDFRIAFEFEKNVKNGIHLLERQSLKKMLIDFEEKNQKRIIPFGKWLWLSAAAMLIFGILFWLSTENQPNNEDLYLSYYQSYPNVVAPIVRGESNQGEKRKAFEAYEQEKYQKAVTLFHQIYRKTNEEYALFYEGQCYLASGETQKGIDILENAVFTDHEFPFKTQQKWYLALAYLKLNKLDKAKMYLQVLTKTNNVQRENAVNLLKSLP